MGRAWFGLTKRQAQILEKLAQAMDRKAIASDLDLSVKTIDFHIGMISRQLGLSGDKALVKFAIEHGMAKMTMNGKDKSQGAAQPATELRTTDDLAQALMRAASAAAAGTADVLQVDVLCKCTDSIINLSRVQMEYNERAKDAVRTVRWLQDGKL